MSLAVRRPPTVRNLEEARILVEAGGNASGTIDFTTATVVVN
jgi:hypothetical protein